MIDNIPYQYLEPYTEDKAFFFFGREEWRKKIIESLKVNRLTILYGESGVGKSSLLQAGVANSLRRFAEENREEKEIGVPKFTVVVFKDWDKKYLLKTLMGQVQKAVAEAMKCDLADIKQQAEEIKAKRQEEAKKKKRSLPSKFIQDWQAWAEIVSGGYWDGKLFIILDQFEEYFQQHPEENKFAKDFADAVNYPNLSVNFLISIRSDMRYKLDQFKSHIPGILDNRLELEYLDRESAEEAIKKPIERYNFIQQLTNSRLSILSGQKNAGKSFMIQAGVIPYLNKINSPKSNIRSNIPSLPVVLFNTWDKDKDPLDELVKQIKENIGSFLDEQGQDFISDLSTLREILAAWKKYIKVKYKGKKILIVLDQFEQYLHNFKNNFHKNQAEAFKDELRKVLFDYDLPVNFLISIRKNALEDLKDFMDSDWCDHYLELSQNSVSIQSLEDRPADVTKLKPSTKIEQAFIENEEQFITNIIEKIRKQKSDNSSNERLQNNPIVAPYLQLVMTELWNNTDPKDEKRILSLENLRKLALKTFQELGEIEQIEGREIEQIKDIEGREIEGIVKKYVKKKINSKDLKEKVPNALEVVPCLFYYLCTPSGSQHSLSVEDLIESSKEETDALNLPSLRLEETEVIKLLRYLTKARIILPIGSLPKQRYQIYFDGLISAILSWRTEYINQLRKINLKQNLPTQSLAQFRKGKRELAALLAFEAYKSHQDYNYPTDLSEVDAASRKILSQLYFSCCLDCYDSNQQPNERDFWQVKFNSDGTMLAASNQDGSLWLWDVQKEDIIPELLGSPKEAHNPENKLSGLGLDIALAFSKDDKMLISSGRDGIINFWDISNFKPICPPLSKPTSSGFTSVVVFSKNADKILAAGDNQGKVWLWNISDISKTQQPIELTKLNCPANEKGWIWSVDASPDGKLLAAGGGDGIVYLWNIEDPQNPKLIRSLKRHKEEIFCVAFSPNGEFLASGSRDSTVCLWKLKQIDNYIQNPLKKVLKGHKKGVRAIAFDSNSGSGKQVVIFALSLLIQSGLHRLALLLLQDYPNSNKLASASEDHTIRVWNLENLKEKPQVLTGHSYDVCSVAFHPQEPQRLVSCSWDRTIRFWTLGTEPKIFKVFEKDTNKRVLAVTWIDETRFALVRSDGIQVRKDDKLTNLDRSIIPPFKVPKEFSAATFSGEGQKQKIAVGCTDGSIYVYDIEFQEQNILCTNTRELQGHKRKLHGYKKSELHIHRGYKITLLAFSPDGMWLASVSYEECYKEQSSFYRIVKLWDLHPSSQPHPPNPKVLIYELGAPITSFAFYPLDKNAEEHENHKYLVMVDSNGYITLSKCDINQSSQQHPTKLKNNEKNKHDQLYGYKTPVNLALSDTLRNHERRLVSVSDNNNSKEYPCIVLWSLNHSNSENQEEIPELCRNLTNYNFSPTSVALSNNGKFLAVGYYDGSILMWNSEKLDEMENSDNKKIKIEPSSILQGHEEEVNILAFSPNGKKLLSASYDNTVRLWTVETEDLANELKKKLYRDLTNDERQEFLGVSSQLQPGSESS
ncbi:MAG: WD40 repeat domain-containing protein [Calothrix sp. MO_192.B10]|nr:WD40 repeat domain-containing protein [Calothrix sp. MO_192.B10]